MRPLKSYGMFYCELSFFFVHVVLCSFFIDRMMECIRGIMLFSLKIFSACKTIFLLDFPMHIIIPTQLENLYSLSLYGSYASYLIFFMSIVNYIILAQGVCNGLEFYVSRWLVCTWCCCIEGNLSCKLDSI